MGSNIFPNSLAKQLIISLNLFLCHLGKTPFRKGYMMSFDYYYTLCYIKVFYSYESFNIYNLLLCQLFI